MSDDHWKELVRRFANGRPICNCGRAYANPNGACLYGCQAAQLFAREYIAKQVLEGAK